MSEPSDNRAVDAADRISSLPRNVIDRIMECMPIRDAVRTSILSRKWRYMWAGSPMCLVLDKQFLQDIKNKRPFAFENDFVSIVNGILLQHYGPISKFVLDISEMNPPRYSDVDRWLGFFSRMDVRELKLDNSHHNPYKIHSSVFSCHELTYLSISNCIFKPPTITISFGKLKELYLKNIALEETVLSAPLLTNLDLRSCRGIRDFKISAPVLERLILIQNDDLQLSHYVVCKSMKTIWVCPMDRVEHLGHGERMDLTKFLGVWPLLSELWFDGLFLRHLAAGTVPERLPFTLNHLRHLVLFKVTFNLDEIACILCLLRSSPMLHYFYIWGSAIREIDTEIENYLKEAVGLNHRFDQLRNVTMRDFKGSGAELFLVKLILGSSPLLESMYVQEDQKLNISERLRISKELMRFPRASPRAEVMFQSAVP